MSFAQRQVPWYLVMIHPQKSRSGRQRLRHLHACTFLPEEPGPGSGQPCQVGQNKPYGLAGW